VVCYHVAITWQESADPTVGILDGTFLPGTMWIAEVDLGADLFGEQAIDGEFDASIEGDGPAATLGKPLPSLADPPDQGIGLTVGVRQQAGKAGLAFDHGGQGDLAALAPKDQQIRFSIAKSLAIFDLGRPLLDRAVGRNEGSARFPAVTWSLLPTGFRQVIVEASDTTLGPVGWPHRSRTPYRERCEHHHPRVTGRTPIF
jgi:hypothetical protein